MSRVRDYHGLAQRVRAAGTGAWRVRTAGEVWGYPFLMVTSKSCSGAPTVMLSGGMHGEEPAGVEAVVQWLEGEAGQSWSVNWFILPCINPYGWERNQRTNGQRRDINRQFRGPNGCPEAELIKQLVRGRQFLFSMEFHEDVDASGYYLYELRRDPPMVGERILAAVEPVLPLNRDPIIDGNRASGPGLIRRDAGAFYPERRARWPMAYHLYGRYTKHVLGSETPLTAELATRVRAHTAALETALAAVCG